APRNPGCAAPGGGAIQPATAGPTRPDRGPCAGNVVAPDPGGLDPGPCFACGAAGATPARRAAHHGTSRAGARCPGGTAEGGTAESGSGSRPSARGARGAAKSGSTGCAAAGG